MWHKETDLVAFKRHDWIDEFPAAITVCDSAGLILELNKEAVESFRTQGGKKLLGSNLIDCHPEAARRKLMRLMKKHQTNVYTVTRGSSRKIVLQAPWYKRKRYRGFVEVSLKIHAEIPNIKRKP
jgi:transcriptional regulator with PAS, ATPase and Fis domain